MKKIFSLFVAVVMTVGAMAVTQSIDLSAQGYSNQEEVVGERLGDVVVVFDKGTNSNACKYYTTGTAVRCYGGSTVTFASDNATITNIKLTFGSGDGTNAISANVGSFATDTWTGSASTVVLTIGGTSGHRRIKGIEVTYTTSAGGSAQPFAISASVANKQISITPNSDDSTYFYGLWSESVISQWAGMGISTPELILTATMDMADVEEDADLYTGAVSASFADLNLAPGNYTFVVGGVKYVGANRVFTTDVERIDFTVKAPFVKPDVFTVSGIIEAYDEQDVAQNDSVVVRGTISRFYIKDAAALNQYHNVCIYVTDGEKEYEFYNCFSLEKAYFTSVDAYPNPTEITDANGLTLHVGDMVAAAGKATKYNTTYELASGCYLVEAPTQGGETEYTVHMGVTFDASGLNVTTDDEEATYFFVLYSTEMFDLFEMTAESYLEYALETPGVLYDSDLFGGSMEGITIPDLVDFDYIDEPGEYQVGVVAVEYVDDETVAIQLSEIVTATYTVTAEDIAGVATNLEALQSADLRKLYENGQLIIVKDGVRYSIAGQVVGNKVR